jgi:two-component system response regulator MprA
MSAPAQRVVLVVDDDNDLRDTLVEILADRGYLTMAAGNGAEALGVLRANGPQPDLIILDLAMPLMDARAFRAAQLGHKAWSRIPVLLMSAERNIAQFANDLGVPYLTKPVEVSTLIGEITRLVANG